MNNRKKKTSSNTVGRRKTDNDENEYKYYYKGQRLYSKIQMRGAACRKARFVIFKESCTSTR